MKTKDERETKGPVMIPLSREQRAQHAHRLELMIRCLNIPLADDVAAMQAGAAALRGADLDDGWQATKGLTAAMDNTIAWRLGEVVTLAHQTPAGDMIDLGLALCRILKEQGFILIPLPPSSTPAKEKV